MNVEGYDACNMLFRDPNISVEEKGRGCWSRKLFCGDKRTVQKQSVTTRGTPKRYAMDPQGDAVAPQCVVERATAGRPKDLDISCRLLRVYFLMQHP